MNTPNLKPIEWSDETLEDAINGTMTVKRLGRPIPYRLTKQGKQTFEQAKEQGYILFPSSQSLRNVFSQWCEIHERPYIYAEKRWKYASVKMDLIFCNDRKSYERDALFTEKLLTVISAVGVPDTSLGVGGTYNYVDKIPVEHAGYLAQSFLAIYRQLKGENVKAPAFPSADEAISMPARIEEAKAKHLAYCHSKQKWIHWRWQKFCEAYRWPFVEVDEEKRGTARVVVDMPEGVTFLPGMEEAITQLAQEIGLKSDAQVKMYSEKHFSYGEKGIRMPHPIPTDNALHFAEGIAKILDDAGYFPPVDESWHE